jgi:hypothetical protein
VPPALRVLFAARGASSASLQTRESSFLFLAANGDLMDTNGDLMDTDGDLDKTAEEEKITEEVDTCRICHGDSTDGRLFKPCRCKGTCAFVHVNCLDRWRTQSTNPRSFYRCEQCLFEYKLSRIFDGDRFFVARALEHRFAVEFISVFLLAFAVFLAGFISKLFGTDVSLVFFRIDWNHFSGGALLVGLGSIIGWIGSLVGTGYHSVNLFNQFSWQRASGKSEGSTSAIVTICVCVGLALALYWIYERTKEYAKVVLERSVTVVLETHDDASR